MATSRFSRDAFDRNRDFVTTRQLLVGGKLLGPGVPFDKAKVTTRRLRLMYDHRMIVMTEGTNGFVYPQTQVGPVQPHFDDLPDEALQDWLKARDIVPKPKSSHDALVKRCIAEWEKSTVN